jgi:hypothetical protein
VTEFEVLSWNWPIEIEDSFEVPGYGGSSYMMIF